VTKAVSFVVGLVLVVAACASLAVLVREREGLAGRLRLVVPWLVLWALPEVAGIALAGTRLTAPVVLLDVLVLAKMAVVACVGLQACTRAGLPGLPFTRRLAGLPALAADGVPPSRMWAGVLMGVLSIAWTALLFGLLDPRPPQSVLDACRSAGRTWPDTRLTDYLLVVQVAIGEELIFRLGLQGLLMRWSNRPRHPGRGALLVTAAIFTLAHVGQLDPSAVKLAQMLPIALALGWLQVRAGTEACIVAHLLFNLGVTAGAGWLLPA
jgi:membrane protease YdiL (CAAX protease family)